MEASVEQAGDDTIAIVVFGKDEKGKPHASVFSKSLNGTSAQAAPAATRHSIELATAALLVEVVRSDAGIQPTEPEAVLRAVREKFGLSDDEAQTLFRLAEEEVKTANDYYQFTSLINRQFSQQQKQRVIELMWQVAYADAELAAHENHVLLDCRPTAHHAW